MADYRKGIEKTMTWHEKRKGIEKTMTWHEKRNSDRSFRNMGWFALIAMLVLILLSIMGLLKTYPLNVQTGRLYVRCQEAGDLETLSTCLIELLGNMQEVGMVEGRDQRFFPGPDNDMVRDYANLQVIQMRAQQVAQENQFEELAYQYAMTEMRDQLQALDIHTRDWFLIHTFKLAGLAIHVGWAVWGVALIAWVIWAMARDLS